MGWILGLLALATSAGSVGLLMVGQYRFAAIAHLFSAFFGARGSMRFVAFETGRGYFEYCFGLGLPCVGGAAVWLHAVLERLTCSGDVAKDYVEYIDPVTRLGEAKLPDVRRGPGPNPEALEPLTGVLTSDAPVDEKRHAVARLARLETPQAVQALREALQSDSREVRFLAANAISTLEQRLSDRLHARRRDGGKPGEIEPEEALEIAQAYFDYAYYGLAGDVDKDSYMQHALDYVRSAWEGGHDPKALLLWGRVLLQRDECGQAVEMFTRYLTCEPNDVRGYLWRAEAHFQQGEYRAVRRDCTTARQLGDVPAVTSGAVDMWAPSAQETMSKD